MDLRIIAKRRTYTQNYIVCSGLNEKFTELQYRFSWVTSAVQVCVYCGVEFASEMLGKPAHNLSKHRKYVNRGC
jgi:hypothetical protein